MRIPKNFSLGWFPQLNPAPRMRLAPDGEVLYANPASIFLLQELQLDPGHPELLLPPDFQQRLDAMLCLGGGTRTWTYCRRHHRMQCLVHYLPGQGYFHLFLTPLTQL